MAADTARARGCEAPCDRRRFGPGTGYSRANTAWRCFVGDKGGKKDKEKGQKQHAVKNQQQKQEKQDKQPKRRP